MRARRAAPERFKQAFRLGRARGVGCVQGQFDHVVGVGSTGAASHRTVDDVPAHVRAKGLVQRQSQTRVGARIAAALTGGDSQFTNPLGENLAFLGILTLFAVLDVRPLGMASHNTTPKFSRNLDQPRPRRDTAL